MPNPGSEGREDVTLQRPKVRSSKANGYTEKRDE